MAEIVKQEMNADNVAKVLKSFLSGDYTKGVSTSFETHAARMKEQGLNWTFDDLKAFGRANGFSSEEPMRIGSLQHNGLWVQPR